VHTVQANFGYTVWSNAALNTMTLDLKATATVSRIRLLNYDWDTRFHQYRIDASLDKATWTNVVDASTGTHQAGRLAREWPGALSAVHRAVQLGQHGRLPGGMEIFGTRPTPVANVASLNVQEGSQARFYVRLAPRRRQVGR